jgi:hypothetical protein
MIRKSEDNIALELRYIKYLGRRIAKHLLNEPLPEEYNEVWSKNVEFFREEILQLIQKTRTGVSAQEAREIFKEYYKLWIEVEQNIIKDKESICQLYENLLKDSQ